MFKVHNILKIYPEDLVSFTINDEKNTNDDDRQMIRNGLNIYSKNVTVNTPDKTEKTKFTFSFKNQNFIQKLFSSPAF